VAAAGDIAVSVGVRELLAGKAFRFDDMGHHALKGLPDPVQVYGVLWKASPEGGDPV
jgi:class 3 adenylate cyclase